MKKKWKWIGLVALFLFAFVIGEYLFSQKHPKEDKTYKLIYIPKIRDKNNDFWTSLLEGVEMAAEEEHVALKVYAPKSEEDYDAQKNFLKRAIQEKPDGILISPSSYTELTEELQEVKDAGIKLTFLDSNVNQDMEDLLVATDNVESGITLGRLAGEYVNEEEQIAIVGHVKGSSTAIERERGFREGLEEKEGQVVKTVFCGSDYRVAYDLTVDLIKEYPDIGLIAGLNEYSAVGVAEAIKDLGLKEQVKVVGIDSSLKQVHFMEEGIMKGIVIQRPFNMGYLGVTQTIAMLQGKNVEQVQNSGTKLITLENMYTDENQKLLFPFRGK